MDKIAGGIPVGVDPDLAGPVLDPEAEVLTPGIVGQARRDPPADPDGGEVRGAAGVRGGDQRNLRVPRRPSQRKETDQGGGDGYPLDGPDGEPARLTGAAVGAARVGADEASAAGAVGPTGGAGISGFLRPAPLRCRGCPRF